MAKSAADAVKSPKIQSEEPKDGGSDLHPVVQYKLETHAQVSISLIDGLMDLFIN